MLRRVAFLSVEEYIEIGGFIDGGLKQQVEFDLDSFERVEQEMPDWQNRAHFFGVAARLMRQILVDHARSRKASKRGGEFQKIALDDAPPVFSLDDAGSLLSLDAALTKLAAFDERKARVLEMRAFGGMTIEDTAQALGLSEPTIKRDMRLAQAWLRRELKW